VLALVVLAKLSETSTLRRAGTSFQRKLPKTPCGDKGDYCDIATPCCRRFDCSVTSLSCCLPAGTQGCEFDGDCCTNYCAMDTSTCCDPLIDPYCFEDEMRDCGIHGQFCNNTLDGTTCCGDVKYFCDVVDQAGDSTYSDYELNDGKCCIPEWGKGCGGDYHCCNNTLVGGDVYCDPLLSQCVVLNGEVPDDSAGTPSCHNKGGNCTEIPCCGSRLDCLPATPDPEDPTIPTYDRCCIISGLQGCESDFDCCSEHCQVETSTCCIAIGVDCNDHNTCCSSYCDFITHVCSDSW